MAALALGLHEFYPNCEEIRVGPAAFRTLGVSGAQAAELGQRMAGGEFGRLKTLALVCNRSVAHYDMFLCVTLGLQGRNHVGNEGACGLGHGLRSNTSLQELYLVCYSAFAVFVSVCCR